MESETSAPSNVIAESNNSTGVKLEETFITLEANGGHSSQKIPLMHFLETILGGKVDNDVKLKVISLLGTQKCSLVKSNFINDANANPDNTKISESPSESKGENVKLKLEVKEAVEKSKRGGRPRKTKIESLVDGKTSVDSCSHSAFIHDLKDKDTSSTKPKDQANVTPSLRRSSRVPTKNSKFKDDFVDSSIITSKGSMSSDTRLMTLALAAECHITKPKQSIPPGKSQSIMQQGSSSNSGSEINDSIPEQGRASAIPETKRLKEESKMGGSINEDIVKSQAGESTAASSDELIEQVLKRALKKQFSLCVTETKSQMSEKPFSQNPDYENSEKGLPFPYYYIITEPKGNSVRDPFLVQTCNNGFHFNKAVICGDIPKEQSIPTSSSSLNRIYFQCNFCEKVFKSASRWQSHCEQVHDAQSYISPRISTTLDKQVVSCHLCSQKFPFKFMLDNHLQKHENCNSFSCHICAQKFYSQDEVNEHLIFSHSFQMCSNCAECFKDNAILREHVANCSNLISSCDSNVSSRASEVKEKLYVNVITNMDNNLVSQEDELYNEGGDTDIIESESVDRAVVKVECELCELKFSTYSGLWHHKLDTHQEYFTPDLKEKLESRLEKTQQMLSSVSSSDTEIAVGNRTKSNYFVVMKPKWFCSKMQLTASMDSKRLNFSSNSDEVLVSGQPPTVIDKGVIFHCKQCSTHYQAASDYREHRSKVHNECFETLRYLGAWQCTYCSDTFPCEFMLHEHLKQHTGKRLLPCTLCGLTFHKIQERRQHWKQTHPGVGCPNCGKMYASINYLQKHISLNCQDHYPPTKKFIAFRKKQHNDFYMDEKDKRVEKRLIKCHLCSKICSSVHGWRRHMSENHEDEGFSKLSNTCIICNEVIYGYKALEKHLLEVHGEDSGLPIEEENSIIKQAMENSKVRIQDYKKAGKSYSNIFQDEEGMFHCPECSKTHSDIKAINIHIKTHVNMQLECSICKKSFKNPSLLKQHVMRHRTTAVYNCETCGKNFLTLQKLNKHNKVHHTKETFVCELCGMSFALNDYLLKHKKSHTENRPHSCSVCGKSFRTKPELRVHLLIHTQETPYVCEHCGRGFTQKGNWRIHLAQHTGVKPHKCDMCELSFALPSHLKRHLVTHNQKINYRCMWCDKECTQRKHMQMHVSRVHKEDFFQYEEQMKLDNPIPIAPSQMKIYNRRLGKAGQVRKPYKTRAKKCKSSIQDILAGAPIQTAEEEEDSNPSIDIKPMIVEGNEETVTSDISITHQDITADNMQILVSEDHQNYVKHDIPAGLIEEDGSNVEIVMGDNNEINIIINNADNSMSTDLALQDGLDETGPVSLTHFTDASGQLPSSLQQAVNALVSEQKGEVGDDSGLPLDMDAMIAGDNYTIVYPSGS